MDKYCLLGNPVAHSRSPWIHGRFAELTGEPVEYGRRLAPLDAFVATVREWQGEGGKGCNVTIPFKFEAASLADEVTLRARLAGACNTLRFDDGQVFGDNTDGWGLVNDITVNAGVPIAGADVLLVGAGGAGAGALGPLIGARPRRVVVANRTAEKAVALVERHASFARENDVDVRAASLESVSGAFGLVINATASSLSGGGVPVSASALAPGALAYDMMYGAAAQGFLNWARDHGANARDGLGMLVGQAAESFHVWRGVRPPAAQVLAELRALLENGS